MQAARHHRPLPSSRRDDTPVPESEERLRDADPGPLSHEPQMETHAHLMQVVFLLTSLLWWWRDRKDFFASGNLSVYYPAVSPESGRTVRRKLAFRGPDFFVVLGAKPKPSRNSWVIENEDGRYPDVIVEVLSKRTQATDRGKKKEIYEKIFRTPEYFLFDPMTAKLEGYRLVKGRYAAIKPDARGLLPSERLGLALGLHEEPSLGHQVARLFTKEGALVPIPEEVAAEAVKTQTRLAARAERLAAKLRSLGVDPSSIR